METFKYTIRSLEELKTVGAQYIQIQHLTDDSTLSIDDKKQQLSSIAYGLNAICKFYVSFPHNLDLDVFTLPYDMFFMFEEHSLRFHPSEPILYIRIFPHKKYVEFKDSFESSKHCGYPLCLEWTIQDAGKGDHYVVSIVS
jgi:hypothetical protein